MRSTKIDSHIRTTEKPAKRRKKQWLINGIAILLVLALVAGGFFSVQYALTAADQRKQIAALESAVSSQGSLLEQQQSAIDEQSKALEKQQSTIESQKDTIKKQENTIKEQANTISSLNKQLIAKKNSQKKPSIPTVPAETTISTPNVSHLGGKKLVALTFDDGPGPYTGRLLDAMKKRGVKATFFLAGTRVNSYKNEIKRMEAEGHEVGNHSQTHTQLTTLSAAGINKDMDACASKIKAILGHEPTVMRCPYGSFNNNVKSYAAAKGIPIIQWSVDTEDWRYSSYSSASATTKIMNNTFKSGYGGVGNGSIVLMHDIHKNSVDAAIAMMDKLAAQGYTMVTVSELLAARESKVVAGKVYY